MTDVMSITSHVLHHVTVIGVVLAAGFGARMGGRKARLVVGGEHLLAAHVRRLRLSGCDDVIAVVREGDEELAAHVVVSPAYDPAGSLRVALASIAEATDFVVITPVDVTPARVSTIRSLVDALAGPEADAATPIYDGRGGHPVVLRRGALDALERHASLRDLLRDLGPRRRRVVVDDPAVVTDFDEPSDVLAQTGASPTFVR